MERNFVVLQENCIRCDSPITHAEKSHDSLTGMRTLLIYCSHCKYVRKFTRPDTSWQSERVSASEEAAFLARVNEAAGDVQANKANPAAKKTLAMARPVYSQVGGCVVT